MHTVFLMAAMPVDSRGNPFDCSKVYASGNIAADMLANATAESAGRMLACQPWKMTDDKGMKDMLAYLVARDSIHQEQWLAAWEALGERKNHPIPDNFPRDVESEELASTFFTFGKDDSVPVPEGAWSSGESFSGKYTFRTERMEPRGQKPNLGKASPKASVQKSQESLLDEVLGSL